MTVHVRPLGPGTPTGLLGVADQAGLVIRDATWVVATNNRTLGGVFGQVTPAEARRIVSRLAVSDDPGDSAPDLPWAAVAVRADRTVSATASMMLTSGLFHTDTRLAAPPERSRNWCVGTDPLQVVRARGMPLVADMDFLRGFTLLRAPVNSAPFVGVRRSPVGDTLIWRAGGQASEAQWCGPGTLPQPTRTGESVIADYLDAFDSVVAGLVERAGVVVTTLSGGLDSTFMAASLARAVRAAGIGPIQAYCQSPLPAARAAAEGRWDADDLPYAAAMAGQYSDVIALHALRNEARRHPLDVAAEVSQVRGWPVSAVGNISWLTDFADHALAAGTPFRFFGTHGNAAYSDNHLYAVDHYLRRGRPWRALALASRNSRGDLPARTAVRVRLVDPLRPGRPPYGAFATRQSQIGRTKPEPAPQRPRRTRTGYLEWLTLRLDALPAAANPAATPGNLVADPYPHER